MAEVEIYTNKGCPACVSVKQYLDRKGIEYVEKKLGNPKTDLEFSIRTKNVETNPSGFINGEWIGVSMMVRYDRQEN